MAWRVNQVAVVAVTTVVAAAGCAQTVTGTARRTQPAVPDPTRSYGYAEDRCGLLVDGSIKEALGADNLVRPYSGAVCQYVMARGSAMVDVTYSWYETGNLDRERALARERGATLTEKAVERHEAFLARRDTTGAACSATAAAGSGVLSWWVQFRGQRSGDPCKDAEKLVSATLQSNM